MHTPLPSQTTPAPQPQPPNPHNPGDLPPPLLTTPPTPKTPPNPPTPTPQEIAPTLDALGLDLLARMLVYDPAQRVTAREALTHPYFADLQALVQGGPRLG